MLTNLKIGDYVIALFPDADSRWIEHSCKVSEIVPLSEFERDVNSSMISPRREWRVGFIPVLMVQHEGRSLFVVDWDDDGKIKIGVCVGRCHSMP
jgi:hypothetical protein